MLCCRLGTGARWMYVMERAVGGRELLDGEMLEGWSKARKLDVDMLAGVGEFVCLADD